MLESFGFDEEFRLFEMIEYWIWIQTKILIITNHQIYHNILLHSSVGFYNLCLCVFTLVEAGCTRPERGQLVEQRPSAGQAANKANRAISVSVDHSDTDQTP